MARSIVLMATSLIMGICLGLIISSIIFLEPDEQFTWFNKTIDRIEEEKQNYSVLEKKMEEIKKTNKDSFDQWPNDLKKQFNNLEKESSIVREKHDDLVFSYNKKMKITKGFFSQVCISNGEKIPYQIRFLKKMRKPAGFAP